jgi:hypothetical protein
MVLLREEQELLLLLEKSGERATEHELQPKFLRLLATHKHCLKASHSILSQPHFRILNL